MRRATSLAAATVLLALAAPGTGRAGHTGWGCWNSFPATSQPTNISCGIFLTGVPTAVKGTVTQGAGSLHVSITFDPVTGVRGPAIAECTATRSAGCEHTVGVGERITFPGVAGNTLKVWCHVEAPAGVAGTYTCTSGFSL